MYQFPHQEQPPGSPAGLGCPAGQGGHRECQQRDISRVLQLAVLGAEKDRRPSSSHWLTHTEPAHRCASLQDGNSGICQIHHQKPGVDSLHRHSRRLSPCPDAQGHKKVSAFCGQQASLPVHLSPLWIGHFTSGVHKATATSRCSVKKVRCEAAHLLRRLADPYRYSRTGPTACPDDHQFAPVSRLDHQLREVRSDTQPGLPVHRDAVQHSTVHSGAPAENASQSPVRSPTLDDQPRHHSTWSAQIAGHGGVHGSTGPTGKILPPSSPVMGRHSLMPEVTLFTDASSSAWGAQLGSHSTQGLWSASQRSWHINILEMQAIINAMKAFLPHLRSRVVRLMCDNAVTVAYIKNEGGTRSYTLMQLTLRLLKWCDHKARSGSRSAHQATHQRFSAGTCGATKIRPKWDLHLVLMALMSPPFALEVGDQAETSDDIIPLKWRTMKTAFLLALASARWRSCPHALSVTPGRCVFSRGNTHCQLRETPTVNWGGGGGGGGGWKPSKRLTHELIGSTTTELHVRGCYLTFCQLCFGGHRESSRIPICETWPVSLMGCQLWVQWWSHNKSWIQDISHLHSLHALYAATATTFLMKITWLLAGIFMYGIE